MLSLIPAFLLMTFYGPAALERFGHEGRIPDALRALERAMDGKHRALPSQETPSSGETQFAQAKKVFSELAALTNDAHFSAAVAFLGQNFLLAAEGHDQVPAAIGRDRQPPVSESRPVHWDTPETDGRRTRDGPAR